MDNSLKMGKFLVARHHESEWNKLGLWTGKTDVHLSRAGFDGSLKMGLLIKDFHIDQCFISSQVRSLETLKNMLDTMDQKDVPVTSSSAINERDYGDYTGKNKWELQKIFGNDKFNSVRRDWDCPIPGGETLKMVYERVIPYYKDEILPILKSGKNVLLVAHGNSIRALMKYIEKISDEDISKVEMPFGAVIVYDVDDSGYIIDKKVLQLEEDKKI